MSYRSKVRPMSSAVRTWPYPYFAAVSISNDVDYCGFELFDVLMEYMNTSRATRLGLGLRLEVTSSVFGFSPPGRQFAYFDGLDYNAPRSRNAPRIAEYIRSGWIDANHCYGDFDHRGGFRRAHAERFVEEMASIGGDMRTFINHGDLNNRQCVGPGQQKHHMGDVPGSAEYHSDLLSPPQFVTTSAHDAVGSQADISESGRLRVFRRRARQALVHGAPHSLLRPYVLRDGTRVFAFYRLRGTGHNAPNLSSLNYQVGLIDFDKLSKSGACVVLYQHLGVLERVGGRCRSATVDDLTRRPGILSGLRRLAHESESGRTWVPGLQRLLDYALMLESTKVVALDAGSEFRLESPMVGARPESFFGGLTIYAHPSAQATVWFGDVPLPVTQNGPDETGRYSVTVLSEPKQDIWN